MVTALENLTSALAQFSSQDEDLRQEAFSQLADRSRPFLHHLLLQSVRSEADRDDLIQDVFQRVWRARERLEFPTPGAWWRFLRTSARNCAVDRARSHEPRVSIDESDWTDVPDLELPGVDALVEAVEDRRRLYELADEAFLGCDAEVPCHLRTRYVLAVKLLVIDKVPWETVCRIVNSCAPDDEMLGRRELDRIAANQAVLKFLAFTELHWENKRLADFLLNGGPDVDISGKAGGGKWTEGVRQAVCMRFHHGLLVEQVAARLDTRMKKWELIAIFDSCVRRFPFVEIMNRLIADIGHIKGAPESLASSGLWNRLIFQYHCQNELSHRDIYDRTAAPAEVAGRQVTLAMLNVGLSNGRLFKKLAEHAARRGR